MEKKDSPLLEEQRNLYQYMRIYNQDNEIIVTK